MKGMDSEGDMVWISEPHDMSLVREMAIFHHGICCYPLVILVLIQ
jgi:hypothetical protein